MKQTSVKGIVIMMLVLMSILVVPASASQVDDFGSWINNVITKTKGTLSGYSTNVPIVSEKVTSQYWILNYDVGARQDMLTMVLQQGKTLPLTDTTAMKAGTEVAVFFNPESPYSEVGLVRNNFYYDANSWRWGTCYQSGMTCSNPVPAWEVQTQSWITRAVYSYSIQTGGSIGGLRTAEIAFDRPDRIDLGGGAYIEHSGFKNNGASPPGGSYVVILDPWNSPHLFKKGLSGYGTLRSETWDDAMTWWKANKPFKLYGSYTWTEVWTYIRDNNRLPADVKPYGFAPKFCTESTNSCSKTSMRDDYTKMITDMPPNGAISSFAVYIPTSLAQSVTIQLGGSRATIISKELSAVTAGQYATLTVKVKNEGSDDYITVKASSSSWQFNTDRKYVKSGATETFTLSGQALGGTTDTTAQYTVTADGTGQNGDDTETGTGTIYGNSGGNTPATLTIKPVKESGAIMSNAKIYVAGDFKGIGQQSVSLYKGEYEVKSEDIDGLYAPTPVKVTMSGTDKSIELIFKPTPPGTDYTWIFWGALFLVVAYLAVVTGWTKTIIQNPSYLIPLVIVLFIIYMLWQALNVAMGIITVAQTTLANPWLPWNWFIMPWNWGR